MYIFFSGAKLLLSVRTAKPEMINKVIAMFNSVKIVGEPDFIPQKTDAILSFTK